MFSNRYFPVFTLGITLILMLSSARFARAVTINVPGDFATIQGAISDPNTLAGDEIVVAPGTYNEIIDFSGKAITVRSSGGAAVTTIDATGVADPGDGLPVVRCDNGEDPNTVLDGFTITGGTGDTASSGGTHVGGGMFNNGTSPTVTHCTFSGNFALAGAGIFNNGASPTVTNCTFVGNTAATGGGMYNLNSSPTVTHCTFSGNTLSGSAGFGGGMTNAFGSPTVTHCTFSGNSAGRGGGMYNLESSSPMVTHCTFSENTATDHGGGMYDDRSNSTVTHCTFSGNTANIGGGMLNIFSSPAVTNCTFSGNTASTNGGGMRNGASSPTLTNCTFSGNTANDFGGGMYNFNSSPTVTNCIIWGNSDIDGMDESGQIHTVSGTPVVNYSDVQGGWTGAGGTGNINADPNFADADGADDMIGTQDDNLRLLAVSPCIDAGDNSSVPAGITTDLADRLRFVDDLLTPDTGNGGPPTVDMGAYEYACTGNLDDIAAVTLPDYALFTQQWMQTDCGLCAGADFNDDNNVTLEDMLIQLANWLCGTGP